MTETLYAGMAGDTIVRLPPDIRAREDIAAAIDENTSCVIVQSPDFFGNSRSAANSPFSVSPGRRPHLRQRSSSWFRDPQKLHVITAHLLPPRPRPDVLSLAFYALPAKLPREPEETGWDHVIPLSPKCARAEPGHPRRQSKADSLARFAPPDRKPPRTPRMDEAIAPGEWPGANAKAGRFGPHWPRPVGGHPR